MKLKIPGHEIEIDEADKAFLSKISKSDFAGLIGGDWVKLWRWNNLLKIVEKVRKKCEEQKLDPKEVAPKFLQSFFEQSSLEDDEAMQDRWSNLLISTTQNGSNIYYINILKELEPYEARLLDTLYHQSDKNINTNFSRQVILDDLSEKDPKQLNIAIHKFYSLGLMRPAKGSGINLNGENPSLETINLFHFTELGLDFCSKACD